MTLKRYPTSSPDHFTCACGYWCLNSSCPRCEEPEPYWSRLPTMHAPILTVYVYQGTERIDTVFCTTNEWHGRYRDA